MHSMRLVVSHLESDDHTCNMQNLDGSNHWSCGNPVMGITIGGRVRLYAPECGRAPYGCLAAACDVCMPKLGCCWRGIEVSREDMWGCCSPASKPRDRCVMLLGC